MNDTNMDEKKVTQEFYSSIPPESKAAIVIPLYGFWNDVDPVQMTAEVLQVAMQRLRSSKHKLYYVFVGEPARLTDDVKHVLAGHMLGGNTITVDVPPFSSYTDYVMAGMDEAMLATDASFLMFFNPWIMIRENGVDQILERTNRGEVGIVTGYETKGLVEAGKFDEYQFNLPKEERWLNTDFACMTRQMSEIMQFDRAYKTHFYLGRDWWQSMYSRGFEVISSQFIPTYSFAVDWTLLEAAEDYQSDKNYFVDKWHFDAGIDYASKL